MPWGPELSSTERPSGTFLLGGVATTRAEAEAHRKKKKKKSKWAPHQGCLFSINHNLGTKHNERPLLSGDSLSGPRPAFVWLRAAVRYQQPLRKGPATLTYRHVHPRTFFLSFVGLQKKEQGSVTGCVETMSFFFFFYLAWSRCFPLARLAVVHRFSHLTVCSFGSIYRWGREEKLGDRMKTGEDRCLPWNNDEWVDKDGEEINMKWDKGALSHYQKSFPPETQIKETY